jgi:hypothetical protein
MNNSFVIFQASQFAARLRREAGEGVPAQVDRAYRLALSRPPRPAEREAAVEFIRGSPNGLAEFCQVLFNLNEFVYRP